MRADIMIYCYGAVCVAMILFNFLCIFVFGSRDRKELRQSENYALLLDKDAERRMSGELPDPKEQRTLTKKLLRPVELSAFARTLELRFSNDPKGAKRYLTELRPVIFDLARAYLKKEDIKAAYFLSFLNRFGICRMEEYGGLTAVVMEYFKKPLLYCSLHALDALYMSGRRDAVLQGLRTLDRRGTYIFQKLIVKGLCSFEGDKAALSDSLKNEFWHFSLPFQTAFIDFFSESGSEEGDFIFSLLTDDTVNEELRYGAIRYFGRQARGKAYPILCRYALSNDPSEWVCASLAATSLAAYGSESGTVAVLKRALSSRNYHVRRNAVLSLERLGITYNELTDILTGDDRFAREMVTYQTERRNLSEEQEVVI